MSKQMLVDEALTDEQIKLERLLEKAKAEGNPWLPMIGVFKDNPLFEEWQEAIRENRRKADEDINH